MLNFCMNSADDVKKIVQNPKIKARPKFYKLNYTSKIDLLDLDEENNNLR